MKRLLLASIFLLALTIPIRISRAQTEDENLIGIENPQAGEAAQGLVQITGYIDLEDWDTYDLEFSFTHQGVWFPIVQGETDLETEILGEWETSAITDGNYDLRLTVHTAGSSTMEILVEGIRVRNYTAIETNTPAPTDEDVTATPTATSASTPTPKIEGTLTPTIPSPNPAEFSTPNLESALIRGTVFGIILFAFLSLIYLRKQNK